MNYTNTFSKVTKAMKSSLIRELVASTKNIPNLISFAGGLSLIHISEPTRPY